MAQTTGSPARPASMVLAAVLAGAGGAAMAGFAAGELPTVLTAVGGTALVQAVLVGAACLGAVLCGYLSVIWALASIVLLVGPAGRTGRALLGTLGVLAPQLARRLSMGAAVATAATGLVLAPATAADPSPEEQPSERIAVSATLAPATELSGARPAPAEGPGPAAPSPAERPAAGQDPEDRPRPALGWSGTEHTADPAPAPAPTDGSDAGPDPARAEHDDAEPDAAVPPDGDDGSDPDPAPRTSPQHVSTVEVRPGDSLWSITDDLLGPGVDEADDVAALWPALHDANRDVVGADPDHLEPGQVLIVPADLSSQEHS